MCSQQHDFGTLNFSTQELKTIRSPDGDIAFGYASNYGGVIGVYWSNNGHLWSFTTFAKHWRRSSAAVSEAEFADSQGRVVLMRVHRGCGQAYPDRYNLIFRAPPLDYETHISFHGCDTITGIYGTRTLTP
jgi:hypothetical protein